MYCSWLIDERINAIRVGVEVLADADENGAAYLEA